MPNGQDLLNLDEKLESIIRGNAFNVHTDFDTDLDETAGEPAQAVARIIQDRTQRLVQLSEQLRFSCFKTGIMTYGFQGDVQIDTSVQFSQEQEALFRKIQLEIQSIDLRIRINC